MEQQTFKFPIFKILIAVLIFYIVKTLLPFIIFWTMTAFNSHKPSNIPVVTESVPGLATPGTIVTDPKILAELNSPSTPINRPVATKILPWAPPKNTHSSVQTLPPGWVASKDPTPP